MDENDENIAAMVDLVAEGAGPDLDLVTEFALLYGVDATRDLCAHFGGLKPHIPDYDNWVAKLRREVRNAEMRARFNGRNYDRLALEYGLAERQARKIIHATSKKPRPQRREEKKSALKISRTNRDRLEALARQDGKPIGHVLDELVEEVLNQSQPVETRAA